MSGFIGSLLSIIGYGDATGTLAPIHGATCQNTDTRHRTSILHHDYMVGQNSKPLIYFVYTANQLS